jgi:hypothetical protein
VKHGNSIGAAVTLALALLCATRAVAAPPATTSNGIPKGDASGQPGTSLQISVRPDGVLSPGQTVELTVDGTPQNMPINAVVVSPGEPGFLKVTALPFKAPLTIPREFVGGFSIQASMSSKPGELWPGDGSVGAEKTLSVKVTAALQRIEVYPTDMLFENLGESEKIGRLWNLCR